MYKLTRSKDLKTSNWAGGTTTQLDIFPPTAEYQQFNFDFRVSFATVEIDESNFTYMPGVVRHLMILKGELFIYHIDRYEKYLKQYDVDTFNGEWSTKAKGRVKDFNLMTKGSYTGSITAVTITDSAMSVELTSYYTGIYQAEGNTMIKYKNESILLNEGDYLSFNDTSGGIELSAFSDSTLILAKVSQKQKADS